MLFELSLRYMLTGRGVRHGNNGYTPHAYPAYVIAVASVEAFLNETMISPLSQMGFGATPLDLFDSEEVERLDLLLKIQLLPQIHVGRTMPRNTQPFQDFQMLVRLRNEIVHYKMAGLPLGLLRDLEQRGIALPKPEKTQPADYLAMGKISCTEGIRWAHNTACRVVHRLVELAPPDRSENMAYLASGFVEITTADVEAALAAMSKDDGKGA
ncbi:MAG: hypothetical protein RDU83_13950 [bacterium]|nr:hypothetical protein [bacterium]